MARSEATRAAAQRRDPGCRWRETSISVSVAWIAGPLRRRRRPVAPSARFVARSRRERRRARAGIDGRAPRCSKRQEIIPCARRCPLASSSSPSPPCPRSRSCPYRSRSIGRSQTSPWLKPCWRTTRSSRTSASPAGSSTRSSPAATTPPRAKLYAPDFANHGLHGDVDLATDQAAAKAWREAMPDLVMEAERVVAEGDTVAVLWKGHGTNTGSFGGLPPKPDTRSTGEGSRLGGSRMVGSRRSGASSIRRPSSRSSGRPAERRAACLRRHTAKRAPLHSSLFVHRRSASAGSIAHGRTP